MKVKLKPVIWLGSSLKDLKALPDPVKKSFGFALDQAQRGGRHPDAKVLKGFGDAGVLELVSNVEGNAYRGVYTVRFFGLVYVLHVFQKKSKRGISTPAKEMNIVFARLKKAESDYQHRMQLLRRA